MQLALEFVLLSFIGLAAFIGNGKRRYVILASVAYACACLTYEPTYAYAPILIAVAAVLIKQPVARAIAVAGLSVPLVAFAAIALWLRSMYPLPATDEHTVHAAFGPVVTTFITQALGAVPLSYRLFNPSGIFAGMLGHWVASIPIALLALRLQFVLRPVDPKAIVRITGPSVKQSRDANGDVNATDDLRVDPYSTIAIDLTSDSPGQVRPPDPRTLLFQVRDARLEEPDCGSLG